MGQKFYRTGIILYEHSAKRVSSFLDIFLEKPCGIKKTIYLCTRKPRNGVIAQLVEQRTENPCVPGSIPGDTTFKGGM